MRKQRRITWYGSGEPHNTKEIDDALAAGWRVVHLAGTGDVNGRVWTAIVEPPNDFVEARRARVRR